MPSFPLEHHGDASDYSLWALPPDGGDEVELEIREYDEDPVVSFSVPVADLQALANYAQSLESYGISFRLNGSGQDAYDVFVNNLWPEDSYMIAKPAFDAWILGLQ